VIRALVLDAPAPAEQRPLRLESRPEPEPGPHDVRVRVHANAVCRTDLHVTEGDLELPHLPVVPGHQIVGHVDAVGEQCTRVGIGDRVGVAWLHDTCGTCAACRRGDENLCERALFTGWTVDGGYADALTVPEDFAVRLPDDIGDLEAAPLLCAGVIGYRAARRAEIEPGDHVALVGFGASAHVTVQVLHHWDCTVAVLTRGRRHQELARELGAAYVGDIGDDPPFAVDRVVNFTPAGETVPRCLEIVRPGGVVALAGIHMSPIPSLPYALLWGERSLRSVANMTRRDAEELMALAAEARLRTEIQVFPLEAAPDALLDVKHDRIRGAAVLDVGAVS
jgi:propanol-preferring alcohol dehydrogenase